MPGIYRVACDSCGLERLATESHAVVRREDGRDEVLPHPLERRTAEELTGKSWRQLTSAGRITYRYAAVCGRCGELAYVLAPGGRRRGHLWNLTRRPRRADQAEPCPSCGSFDLVPITDRRFAGAPCPACEPGRLAVKWAGIS